VNPDLSAFHARGGKLLVAAGTRDPIIPFTYVTQYYDEVIERFGGSVPAVQEFFRLFIVPGQGHGPSRLPEPILLDALVRWIEKNEPPTQLPCTWQGSCERKYTRPAFPYPTFPHYTGGDSTDAANYKPVVHPLGYKYQQSKTYRR